MKIIANVLRYMILVAAMGGFMTSLVFGANAGSAVQSQLSAICVDIQTFVGVLVVVLLALGAVLYAVSNILPAAGNIKGNLQGWSLNMVVGAVVALIIYFLAPFIATQIVNYAGSSLVSGGVGC